MLTNEVTAYSKLKEIETELANYAWGKNYGLLSGKCGYLLFIHQLTQHTPDNEKYFVRINELCESLFEDVAALEITPNLCTGLAGFVFALQRIDAAELIDDEIYSVLSDFALKTARQDHFDFFYGSTGMVFSLMEAGYPDKSFYEAWAEIIRSKLTTHKNGVRLAMLYKESEYSQQGYQYNYSLSHGLSALIIVLIKLLQQGLLGAKYRSMADDLVKSIIALRNPIPDKQLALYPSVIKMDNTPYYPARVSWCYGDLNIALLFHYYGKFTGDISYTLHCKEILDYYATLSLEENTVIRDPDFCHGTAGVALMFRFFARETNELLYQRAAEKWYNETLNKAIYESGAAGYLHYTPKGDIPVYGLLEGISGIGLCILAFQHPEQELKWTGCFLI